MAEVRVQEHVRDRLPEMEGVCGEIMQTADGIQIDAMAFQDVSQQKNQ